MFHSIPAMPRTCQIGLLLYPGCMPAGLLGFADLLHAANRRTGQPLFQTRFVGLKAGPVICSQGLEMQAHGSVDDPLLDAVLVPGFWAESASEVEATLHNNAALIRALARLPKRSQLWSYCVGVSLAAASGRLDGQAATATWWLLDTLRQRHPKIRWRAESTCIHATRHATASGVSGYLPIAQHLIEQTVSPAIVQDLVKLMVLPRPAQTHDAFQSLSLIQQPSTLLRKLHASVDALPADQLTVDKLADLLDISGRTLARKVKDETGCAAATYARRIKLAQVAERLTLTSAPLSAISNELGFSSDSNLQRMFKALTQLTPLQYRQQFSR
ncbi:MAG: GlxA family transcriptional regulator [Stenotrophomonas sp.]